MHLKVKARHLRVSAAAKARLIKALDNWWDASILEWAEAAQSKIPVDTGMAASSLVPLMDDVGGPGRGHFITGHRARIGYTEADGTDSGRWVPGVTKDASLGRQIGGEYIIRYGIKPYFQYSTKIYQWGFHERRWNAALEASNDFNKRAAEQFKNSQEYLSALSRLLEVV